MPEAVEADAEQQQQVPLACSGKRVKRIDVPLLQSHCCAATEFPAMLRSDVMAPKKGTVST